MSESKPSEEIVADILRRRKREKILNALGMPFYLVFCWGFLLINIEHSVALGILAFAVGGVSIAILSLIDRRNSRCPACHVSMGTVRGVCFCPRCGTHLIPDRKNSTEPKPPEEVVALYSARLKMRRILLSIAMAGIILGFISLEIWAVSLPAALVLVGFATIKYRATCPACGEGIGLVETNSFCMSCGVRLTKES